MIKKIFNIILYIAGLLYLVFCLFNVESWVKNHMEEHLFFVILAWIVAILLAIILIVMSLITKKKYKLYLPSFFFAIGLIIHIVASSIPCCTGG